LKEYKRKKESYVPEHKSEPDTRGFKGDGIMNRFGAMIISSLFILLLHLRSISADSGATGNTFSLEISCGSPTFIILKDSNGRKTGWQSALSQPLQEIPGSAAGVDEIDDAVTGEAGAPSETIMVQNIPAPSSYRMQIVGTTQGAYDCSIDASGVHELKGNITKGQIICYVLRFDPRDGLVLGKPDRNGNCE
jgi:hypothetical protein